MFNLKEQHVQFYKHHLVIVNERVIANDFLELLQVTDQTLQQHIQMLQINAIATDILY
jgi:arginyl-tRNA synthetase